MNTNAFMYSVFSGRAMRTTNLQLYDPAEMRRLMACAPSGGLSIRKLAAVVGIGKSRLGLLLTTGPYRVSDAEADRIARALSVNRGRLFASFEHERVHDSKGLGEMASELSLKRQAASHESWARTPNRTARTTAARNALAERWRREAREMHPNGTDEQIEQAAESLRSAHYADLARRSAQARRIKGQLQREKDDRRRRRLAKQAAELARELQEASEGDEADDSAELNAA
ncbi:hypothetical protein [Streptomyces xiamenensis]|uniref:hypothetical protein n=1 Tax=Streptomyces xiamenensis TaxID=408015 RepID=UPI0037D0ADC1